MPSRAGSSSVQMESVLPLFHALLHSGDRKIAVAELAKALSAHSLMIFLEDWEVHELLPAPGFPQTLSDPESWRTLLQAALKQGTAEGSLVDPLTRVAQDAVGVAAHDRTVLVLLGGNPDRDLLASLIPVLPLIADAMRGEQLSARAAVEIKTTQAAAATAENLAHTLDITRSELRSALFHAENASRAKDEFLAVVSHELRSPLNAILGWTQMLQLEDFAEEDRRQALETIERNAKLQAQLIEDILDYERILTGKVRLDIVKVDIADPINAAIDSIRPAVEAKGLKLVATISTSAGPIAGDPSRLQQIVWNLLTNAMKFTPRGGTIHISLARVNSHIELAVSDTGKGIEADFLPYVFDRFRQADATSTRAQGGLGLGLAIVKHLAEMHSGSIEVSSEGIGKGTTFTLKIPVMIAYAAVNEQTAVIPRGRESRTAKAFDVPKFKNINILVVDDNADARLLLQKLLTNHGAIVELAESASAALAILADSNPDILISDIEMPEEDGISLIRKVRQMTQSIPTHIKAIALTAHARPADRQEALHAGFDMHLTKPFEPNELLLLISNLMRSRTRPVMPHPALDQPG